jgi:hypothetical protein
MSRMLMFMHHIAFYTPHALHYCTCGHLLHIRVDHAESESEIQEDQVQGVFDGPQASSYEDANIIVIKANPAASHTILDFYFN